MAFIILLDCRNFRPADNVFVVTGHLDGKAILWNVATQSSVHILDGHHSAVRSVHADRCCAVTGGEDMTCRTWRFADMFVLKVWCVYSFCVGSTVHKLRFDCILVYMSVHI